MDFVVMARFGRATGVTGSGNKAILPPPAPPPKSSNLPVPPGATPGGGKIRVVTPTQGGTVVRRWK